MVGTHYDTLRIAPGADTHAIHAAYKSLCLVWNNEWLSGNRQLAETRLRELNAAFSTLSDPKQRAEYDAQLYARPKTNDGSTPSSTPAQVHLDRNLHTFNSLQHLVMAMADFANSRGKRSLFGHDKSLGAYRKFEEKLRDTVLALVVDGVIKRNSDAPIVIIALIDALNQFAEMYPNWQDAYAFAYEFLVVENSVAEARIRSLMQ